MPETAKKSGPYQFRIADPELEKRLLEKAARRGMTPNAYLQDLAIRHLTEEDRREAEELERREMKERLVGLDEQVRTLRGDLVVSVRAVLLHAGNLTKDQAEEFVQRKLLLHEEG
jgi:hypothetical protein